MRRLRHFGVTRHEIPIGEYPLSKSVNTGIGVRSIYGMVPEFEEREAAVFSQYNWSQWCDLQWQERAQAVAHYRLHSLIDSHVSEAVSKAQERAMKH